MKGKDASYLPLMFLFSSLRNRFFIDLKLQRNAFGTISFVKEKIVTVKKYSLATTTALKMPLRSILSSRLTSG
jgi:hypothetical protein